jgi:transposase
MRQVADRFGVTLATVQRWVERAQGQRLDRVDWTDRPCGLLTPVNRTERQREDLVLTMRQQLRATSDLGEERPPFTARGSPVACPIRPRSVPSA